MTPALQIQWTLKQELDGEMSAGAWLLRQLVLFLISLERVSCGLRWERGATRQPPHSIKQTGFSLITGPWHRSDSLICFKWAHWNLEWVCTLQKMSIFASHLFFGGFLVSDLDLFWGFLRKNICHCSETVAYICSDFLSEIIALKNKASTSITINKLLLKSRRMLKQISLQCNKSFPLANIVAWREKIRLYDGL